MTKQELLMLMRLLSALECAAVMRKGEIPDYLLDEIVEAVEVLSREILK